MKHFKLDYTTNIDELRDSLSKSESTNVLEVEAGEVVFSYQCVYLHTLNKDTDLFRFVDVLIVCGETWFYKCIELATMEEADVHFENLKGIHLIVRVKNIPYQDFMNIYMGTYIERK